MGEESRSSDNELERYRIRYSLYKVVFGTAIVGLASVLIPGSIDFGRIYLEDKRKHNQSKLDQTTQQQSYVKDFLDTALNQDIELRIRFADYFSHVAPEPYRQDWKSYRKSLIGIRKKTREEIHEKESMVRQLSSTQSSGIEQHAKIEELKRQLEWRYKEVGYVARNLSIVPSVNEELEMRSSASRLNYFTVLRDVAIALQEEITHWTPFSISDYNTDIVPNKDLPNGFDADLGNWDLILHRLQRHLHQLDKAYRVLDITTSDSRATIGVPLSKTQTILTRKILDGQRNPDLAEESVPKVDLKD